MVDADALTVRLRTEIGSTRIEEQWNETLVLVNFSPEQYEPLKAKLHSVFNGIQYDFSEDGGHDKPNCSLYAIGPGTSPSKKHRWQINVLSVDDDGALDDLGSYLAKNLEAMVEPNDKFLVVIFDNGARYAY